MPQLNYIDLSAGPLFRSHRHDSGEEAAIIFTFAPLQAVEKKTPKLHAKYVPQKTVPVGSNDERWPRKRGNGGHNKSPPSTHPRGNDRLSICLRTLGSIHQPVLTHTFPARSETHPICSEQLFTYEIDFHCPRPGDIDVIE